jgi:PAS domain S-box-containing protein
MALNTEETASPTPDPADFRLEDVLDLSLLQTLQDRLNQISPFPSAVIDNDGRILTATAWQEVCTQFHRVHPECRQDCIASDQYIRNHIHEANPAVTYRCPHGLVDNAMPIVVNGRHLANFFTGQFFLEPPDLDFFRAQAARYGFDEAAYLDAVKRVPVWSQTQLDQYLAFIKSLVDTLSDIGLKYLHTRETHRALAAGEARYRMLLMTAMDGYWMVDMTGRLLDVNDTYCRMSGYTREELLGMRIPDLEAQESAAEVDIHLRKLVESGEDRFETRHRRKNGSTYDVEISTQYKDIGEGHIVVFLRDITQQKQSSRAFRESQQRLDAHLANSPLAIIEFDPGFHIVRWSGAAETMFGWTAKEVLGRAIAEVQWVHEADVDSVQELMLSMVTGEGTNFCHLNRNYRKDGTVLHCEWYISTLYGPHGELTSVFCNVLNVTARVQAEESFHRLAAIVDSSNTPMISADLDGTIRTWNRAATGLLGYTAAEMIGTSAARFLPPDQPADWKQWVADRLRRGESIQQDGQRLRKDGTLVDVYISLTPLRSADGSVFGFSGIYQDLTERKRLEAEQERTQRLEALGVLAGGIAHDFNNILTGVVGNLSVIRARSTDPTGDLAEILTETEEAAQEAKGLARQLLTFAKGGSPVKKVFDLGVLLRHAAIFSVRGSHAGCGFDIPGDLWPVKADPGQIEQVIQNLVLNAAQAMGGRGAIMVHGTNREWPGDEALPAGRYVEVRIVDSGTGISAQDLPHIFEPYFSTKEQGRGLGLSVAYSIVRNHNGILDVQTRPGQGSTFRFLLPASVDNPPPAKPHPPLQLNSGRVLVMDDDESVVRASRRMLKSLGCEPVIVGDGQEALAAYDQAIAEGRPFRLVIMDLTIPGKMSGREAVSRLKAKHPQARVVVSSGYSNDTVLSDYAKYGFDGVLPKPYDINDISKLLT